MAKREEEPASEVWSNRSHPVHEDMRFQAAEWTAERIGWWIWLGFIVLACLGLFSGGPLSSATIRDGTGGLEAELDRFYRKGATTTVQLRVEARPGNETRILLSPEFLNAFTVQAMLPEPSEWRGVPGGLELVFQREENAPLSVYMSIVPEGVGLVRSEIGLAGSEPARLTQFIFP